MARLLRPSDYQLLRYSGARVREQATGLGMLCIPVNWGSGADAIRSPATPESRKHGCNRILNSCLALRGWYPSRYVGVGFPSGLQRLVPQ